jgi:hypothetical protein
VIDYFDTFATIECFQPAGALFKSVYSATNFSRPSGIAKVVDYRYPITLANCLFCIQRFRARNIAKQSNTLALIFSYYFWVNRNWRLVTSNMNPRCLIYGIGSN